MYLIGTTIALIGRRRYGPEPSPQALAMQVLGSALTVGAVAGYEIVAPAVLLSFLLYRRIGRSGVLWRWALEAVPTVLILIFLTRKFSSGPAPLSSMPGNVWTVVDGAISVLGYTLIPLRSEPRWVVLGAIIIVIAAVLFLGRSQRQRLRGVGDWFGPIMLSIAAIAIGYIMIVPGAERYPVSSPGVQNRANCFAALGLSALTVFVLCAISGLVAAALPDQVSEKARARTRSLLSVGLIFGIFLFWGVRINEDRRRWENAADIQAIIVSGTEELVPSPPSNATLFTSPYPGFSSPSLPIFGGGGNNDELSAFIVRYSAPDLRAFPLLEAVGLECRAAGMGTPDASNSTTSYGDGIFVDLRSRKVYRPKSPAECRSVIEEMKPLGPVNFEEGW